MSECGQSRNTSSEKVAHVVVGGMERNIPTEIHLMISKFIDHIIAGKIAAQYF